MFATLGQYIGGKVITAILVVSGAGAVIYFYNHPDKLEDIWQIIKFGITWIGFVLILPWATFFVTPWVVARDSNLAAGLMLAGYLLVDALFAFYLMGGVSGHNSLEWAVVLLGFLSAAVYNFKACEYQAEKAENC
ncbi:MAG: hypothetical protein ACYTHJ_01160 [Planctomycetota bacterium]|jgi:hypothetical protein